ncbi:MAG: zinc-ribbon domain-containing protein [Vulcanibacillus sp.]
MQQDKIIVCKDCGNQFTFSAGEQEFFLQKGFENKPVRCKECRTKRKANNIHNNQNSNRKISYNK